MLYMEICVLVTVALT